MQNSLLANRPPSDEQNELLVVLGQLYFTLLNSGARYWSGMAELYTKHASSLSRDLIELYNNPELDANERRQRIDKLRTCLRQAVELVDQESRVLRQQFIDADHKLRQCLGEEQADTPTRKRRAKVKP